MGWQLPLSPTRVPDTPLRSREVTSPDARPVQGRRSILLLAQNLPEWLTHTRFDGGTPADSE